MNEETMKKRPRRRTRYPTESFDPRWHKILMAAAISEQRFEFRDKIDTDEASPTFGKILITAKALAMRFQSRLQTYRSQRSKENAKDWQDLYRCRTSRKGHILYVRPQDSEFEDAFTGGGFNRADTEDDFNPEDIEL